MNVTEDTKMNGKTDDTKVFYFDRPITLICPDGNLVISNRHLKSLDNFQVIFRDEPNIKEIPCVHTSEEMVMLFDFVSFQHIEDSKDSKNRRTICGLMHYYGCTDTNCIKKIVRDLSDISSIPPGSESYFQEAILGCMININHDKENWNSADLKFSDKAKIIMFNFLRERYNIFNGRLSSRNKYY